MRPWKHDSSFCSVALARCAERRRTRRPKNVSQFCLPALPDPYARRHCVSNRVVDGYVSTGGRRARSASALQSFRRRTERALGAATEPCPSRDRVLGRSEESSKHRVQDASLEGTRFGRRRFAPSPPPWRALQRRRTFLFSILLVFGYRFFLFWFLASIASD